MKAVCCPVCLGKGIVPNGFYLSPQHNYGTTSSTPETCQSCGGNGYLIVPEDT